MNPEQSKQKASLRVRGIMLDPAAQRKRQHQSKTEKTVSTSSVTSRGQDGEQNSG